MRRDIEYDGTSLQTATIITQEIQHESMDSKQLDVERLANRDGGKFLAATFAPKRIILKGQIKDSSIDNLEDEVDDFKELLNKQGKHLDIEYGTGTGKASRRRYTCNSSRITVLRKHYHLTYVDWEAEFLVADRPFGTDLDTTTATDESIESISTTTVAMVANGTYKPNPKIIITFTEVAGVDGVQVRNTSTGDLIRVNVSNEFANNDVIEIDTDQYTCTINGVASSYKGVFPSFRVGGNDLRVAFFNGVHFKATIQIIYYPLYL